MGVLIVAFAPTMVLLECSRDFPFKQAYLESSLAMIGAQDLVTVESAAPGGFRVYHGWQGRSAAGAVTICALKSVEPTELHHG